MNIRLKIHNTRAMFMRFLLFKLNMAKPPYCFLFSYPCKYGIWFHYKGDKVLWNWPWVTKEYKNRFISLGFSGTGEFGDARYSSLLELDKSWEEYFDACQEAAERDAREYNSDFAEL